MGKIIVCITGDIDYFEAEDTNCLRAYFDILDKYQVKMTIPITAKAVKDYPDRAKFIVKNGHEVAVHGDVHQPFYGSVDDQINRLETAKKIFNAVLGFIPEGFRAPWLRHNKNTYMALSKTGFLYDSSQARHEFPYKTPRKSPLFADKFLYDSSAYFLLKPFLGIALRIMGSDAHPRPFFLENSDLVELPITAPDDWYLISHKNGPRYTPEHAYKIAEIWLEIIRHMKRRKNSLFVVQAHPGRMSPAYVKAIDAFLSNLSSTKSDNSVEIKTLGEVAKTFIT